MLFAHGARDPRWAEPFVRVAERVRSGRAGPVASSLRIWSFWKPDLRPGSATLAAGGRHGDSRRAVVLRAREGTARIACPD